jgi:hypothetical protein
VNTKKPGKLKHITLPEEYKTIIFALVTASEKVCFLPLFSISGHFGSYFI